MVSTQKEKELILTVDEEKGCTGGAAFWCIWKNDKILTA